MRVRPTASTVACCLLLAGIAACSDDGDDRTASVVDTDDCFGFTPEGSALEDGDLIDGGLDAWRDVDVDDDGNDAVELLDDAEACVVYAGPDAFDDLTVTLASEDVTGSSGQAGYMTVTSGKPGVDTGILSENVPVLGVADGIWQVATAVEDAEIYIGSSTGAGVATPVEGTLIDYQDPLAGRDEDRVVVVTSGDSTYVAATSESAGDRPVLLPVGEGSTPLDEVLASPGGVPLAAGAVRNGVRPKVATLGTVEFIGIVEVDGVGTVLASTSVDRLSSSTGRGTPMVQVASESGVVAHPFDPVDTADWAVGLWLDLPAEDATTGTYLAVAHAHDADTEVTVAAGTDQATLPGPVAILTVPVDDAAPLFAAIIATADGHVIPTVAANGRLRG